jgi:hypothetical protein
MDITGEYFAETFSFNGTEHIGNIKQLATIGQCLSHLDSLASRVLDSGDDVGDSIILHIPCGSRLQVGVGKHGWLLIMNPLVNTTIVRRDADNNSIVTFRLPQWTEFNMDCVHPAEQARTFIAHWLETGEFRTSLLSGL